jgi:hypothetical protein
MEAGADESVFDSRPFDATIMVSSEAGFSSRLLRDIFTNTLQGRSFEVRSALNLSRPIGSFYTTRLGPSIVYE